MSEIYRKGSFFIVDKGYFYSTSSRLNYTNNLQNKNFKFQYGDIRIAL